MLRPFSNIIIQQIPTEKWITRNKSLTIDFVHKYNGTSGWEKHTDCLKIIFPKNVILQTEDFLFKQSGTYNVILGGSGAIQNGKNVDKDGNSITLSPLLMKGDIVTIEDGYWYKDETGTDVQVKNTRFKGFISLVHSKIPIEIDCEDNFYLLKRTPVNIPSWNGNLITLCNKMLGWTNDLFHNNSKLNIDGINPYPELRFFSKPDSLTANFSLGHLDIGSGLTCSLLLERLRSQYHLESFFKGDELRFGFPIYDEDTADNSSVFEFQNNIIDDSNLEYKNKDDIILSAIVFIKVINKTGDKTAFGVEKTKREKISVLIYWDIPSETFKYIVKKKDEPFPTNQGGERHEFAYPCNLDEPAPSISTLVDFGIKQLEKYHYTGFRGSFKTFGFPFVDWGDNIWMLNPIVADQNGQYKTRKVEFGGGVEGLYQEIFLDYRLNVSLPTSFSEIYMI